MPMLIEPEMNELLQAAHDRGWAQGWIDSGGHTRPPLGCEPRFYPDEGLQAQIAATCTAIRFRASREHVAQPAEPPAAEHSPRLFTMRPRAGGGILKLVQAQVLPTPSMPLLLRIEVPNGSRLIGVRVSGSANGATGNEVVYELFFWVNELAASRHFVHHYVFATSGSTDAVAGVAVEDTGLAFEQDGRMHFVLKTL